MTTTNPKMPEKDAQAASLTQATAPVSRDATPDAPPTHSQGSGQTDLHDASNTVKDPADWTTGGEAMTGAQASYLKTLSEEAKEAFDPSLSKADASLRIDELQNKTGRGK